MAKIKARNHKIFGFWRIPSSVNTEERRRDLLKIHFLTKKSAKIILGMHIQGVTILSYKLCFASITAKHYTKIKPFYYCVRSP